MIERQVTEEPLGFLDTSKILTPWAEMFGETAVRLRARFRASQSAAVQSWMGLARSPFPPAEAPDFPGWEARLPEADGRVMGKVAALIRGVA